MKTYLKHKTTNLIDIKELTAIEYLNFEGKYNGYVEAHDFWELCFAEKGNVMLCVEENTQKIYENRLILIPPDKKHSYTSKDGNANKAFVICFQCFSQALRPLSEIPFRLTPELIEIIKKIIDESKNTFYMNEDEHLQVLPTPVLGGQQMIILQLEYLLICLLRELSAKKSSEIIFLDNDNFYDALIDAVNLFLAKNLDKKLSLDDICNKFNYSKSFMCKIFKDKTGESIISRFNSLKISEAKKLLYKTELPVTAISNSLGFQEVKYFDYIFKKHTGYSPVAFREIQKNGKEN